MRIACVGSREYTELATVDQVIAYIADQFPHAWIVSGGARGVDRRAEEVAFRHGLGVISYRPTQGRNPVRVMEVVKRPGGGIEFNRTEDQYSSYTQALLARNKLIVQGCAFVCAFWDGSSRGTRHSIDIARRLGIPVHLYTPTETEGSSR